MILSPDTNFFLQCRDPKDLPWADLSSEDEILLVVVRAVQQEIDRLKGDGNSRRSKRARTASGILRGVILSPDHEFIVRDSRLQVRMVLAPLLDPARSKPSTLDLSIADDRVIEETLALRGSFPDIHLLTHDTNPLLTAAHHGLPGVVIPDEWLLGPEPDQRDKTIRTLGERVAALENDRPKLTLAAYTSPGTPAQRIEAEFKVFQPLSEETIRTLVESASVAHPLATDFGPSPIMATSAAEELAARLAGRTRMVSPTEAEIRNYREVEYPEWRSRLTEFLRDLPRALAWQEEGAPCLIELRNEGFRPAENVTVEIEASGGFSFAPPRNLEPKTRPNDPSLEPPRPPTAPRPRRVSPHDALIKNLDWMQSAITQGNPARLFPTVTPRDAHSFYWKDGRPAVSHRREEFECAEFQHRVEPEAFSVRLVPDSEQTGIVRGAVRCRVWSRNVPVPVDLTVPVRLTGVAFGIESTARRLLKLPASS